MKIKLNRKKLIDQLRMIALRSEDLYQIQDIQYAILSGDVVAMMRERNREKYKL